MLKIKNIKKSYGNAEVLKGIHLDICEGEILSLLGINGAGKTTLSSIIATLHPPTEGDIEFNGASIYADIPHFRYKLGYCPQKPNLNPLLTLEQNLIFAGKCYGLSEIEINARIEKLVKQFSLEKYVAKKASILSEGYKQRFMIVRSLLHNPKLIILDEPTVGLDPHIRKEVWEMIKSLKQDAITVLLTTHYLDEAEKLSDRVCILDEGRIKHIDTPHKLMEDFKQKNLEELFINLLTSSQE